MSSISFQFLTMSAHSPLPTSQSIGLVRHRIGARLSKTLSKPESSPLRISLFVLDARKHTGIGLAFDPDSYSRDIRIPIYGIIWPMQNHQSWCRQYPFWHYFAPVTSPWSSPAEDAEPMGVAVSPKPSRPAFFPGAFGASSRPLRSKKAFRSGPLLRAGPSGSGPRRPP
jgi:hypothetical protein